jgi:hypothetical protein
MLSNNIIIVWVDAKESLLWLVSLRALMILPVAVAAILLDHFVSIL